MEGKSMMGSFTRNEQGQASVQNLYVLPLFLAIIFFLIQVGMSYNANNVARSAAEAGYNAARVDGGSSADGKEAARLALSGYGSTFAPSGVSINKGGTEVSVIITGRAPSLVPLWEGPKVHQEVSGPVERWISR
ncbi:TadE family protein [Arthrobacter rhombi]|uniref:TadE family protein n=1 Tax=Arthrobacter rhombi TaxID=71253 RepID=UPI0013044179